MGASQSKAETIYSRYPAESEIFKDIKLTPAVIERISQTQTPVPAPSEKTTPTPVVEVDIEKIKVHTALFLAHLSVSINIFLG